MDRLRKAARAAGFVMAGMDHDSSEQHVGDHAHVDARVAPLPAPARPLLLSAPSADRASSPTLWAWIGGFSRGAPA